MRILFLSHYFPPEGNAPASRVYELAKRWVAAGHTVQVITGVPNVPHGVIYPGYRNKLVQTESMDGIQVIRIWTYIAPNRGTVRRTVNYLSYLLSALLAGCFVPRPDVVIATSPQFFCGWAGALLAGMRRLLFLLEIRDIWPASIVAVGAMQENLPIRCLQRLERRMYALADHIVTVGECYSESLRDRGVPAEKLSVVMNGVDPEIFHPQAPDPDLQRQWGLGGAFVCSYIGTVGMACGLSIVLRAAQSLEQMKRGDIRFLIVGDGAARGGLQAQAQQMGLGNVIFAGLQPKAMIPKFLSITDVCFIHLRKNDVFERVMPSKIFEAAGMAKPVIIGVRGFAREFVLNARSGLAIEPENERELVDAVLRLADDPALCRQHGESGFHHVMTRYTRDILAEEYLGVIERIVGPAAQVGVKETAVSAGRECARRSRIPSSACEHVPARDAYLTVQQQSHRRPARAALAASLLMLLWGCTYRALAARWGAPLTTTPIAASALDGFPTQIADWVGQDVPLDEKVVRQTVTDAHINRRYSRANGTASVSFYVACGISTGELAAHRPEVCYPGSGWMIMDRSGVELTLKDGRTWPCTILQFSRAGVDGERVTVLHYFVAQGQPCREVPLWLQSRVRRAFSVLDCVAQVQIVSSSSETFTNEAATQRVRAFAVDSAPEIARLLERVESDLRAERRRPTEGGDEGS